MGRRHVGVGVPDNAQSGRPPTTRRDMWVVVVCVLVVGLGAGSWVIGSRIQSSSEAAARASAPAASWITAPVELRRLSSTVIQRGDVRPEVTIAVGVPSSVTGAPVVTGITGAVGDDVVEGAKVVEVSGRPVFVLLGDVPIYREMRPGMSGRDVSQLQAGLSRLGCVTDSDAGVYGASTKMCVVDFYSKNGYGALPRSVTDDAGLASARRAVTDAQAAVDDGQAALNTGKAGPLASASVALADSKRALSDSNATAATGVADAQRALADAQAAATQAVATAVGAQAVAKSALDRLQANPDATPADLDQAQVAYSQASSAVLAAQRDGDSSVASAQSALATTRRSGVAAIAAAQGAVKVAEANYADATKQAGTDPQSVALLRATQSRDDAVTALAVLEAATGPIVPQGEIVFLPSFPARIVATPATLGGGGSSAQVGGAGASGSLALVSLALVSLAAGTLQVVTSVRNSDAGLVRAGMDVEILDEVSNTTIAGTVASVAAEPVTGGDGSLGYPAVIRGLEPLPARLTGVNVRLTFTAAATAGEVLVVPLAAVSADVAGNARVQVPNGDGGVADVAVVAGLSADGYVQVTPKTGSKLKAGDLVVVGH